MTPPRDLEIRGPAPPLRGKIAVPGDKSIAHRALILGALADGVTEVRGAPDADDVAATVRCLRALGHRLAFDAAQGTWRVERGEANGAGGTVHLDCAESGTTARLLLGVVAGLRRRVVIDGAEALRRRPMDRVVHPLRAMGARIDGARLPLVVEGAPLRAIEHELAVASAQVKSALLFAALCAEGITRIVEPVRTRDHTERLLERFGAALAIEERGGSRVIRLAGGATLTGAPIDVPGDVSSAFALGAAALVVAGSDVAIPDVLLNPTRTGALGVLRALGASIDVADERVRDGEPSGTLRFRASTSRGEFIVAPEDSPRLLDDVPAIAAFACKGRGRVTFGGAGELRVKESDRIAGIAAIARAFGGGAEETADSLTVWGSGALRGADVSSAGDHRLAMMAAALGLAATGATRVRGFDAVAKSFPGFGTAISAGA